MTVIPCPACARPAVPSDSDAFESLHTLLPEFLPSVGTCVDCWDKASTVDRVFGNVHGTGGLGNSGGLSGREFDSVASVHVSASLSRLYEDRERDRAPVRTVAENRAKFVVEGTDLRTVMAEMVTSLESLQSLRGNPHSFTVNRRNSSGGVSGFYKKSELRVHLCVRADGTLSDAEGVLLHELCHAACAAEGLKFRDTDLDFADKCERAMREWSQKNPARAIDPVIYGAYRGDAGRRNKAAIRNRRAATASLSSEQQTLLRELAASNPELSAAFFATRAVI